MTGNIQLGMLAVNSDFLKSFDHLTDGSVEFTRRHVLSMSDSFGVPCWMVVRALERAGKLHKGAWDWFVDNGGITAEHRRQYLEEK